MRGPIPSRRVVVAMGWLVLLLTVFMVSYLLVQVLNLGSTVGDQEKELAAAKSERAALRDTNVTQDRKLAEANRRLVKAGKRPVAVPPVVPPVTSFGLQGPRGFTGARGPAGLVGRTGVRGPIGPRGVAGADGAVGAVGGQGPKGDPGANGADGANGKDGSDGKDGRSVDSVDCSGPPTETFTFHFSDGTTQTVTCTP